MQVVPSHNSALLSGTGTQEPTPKTTKKALLFVKKNIQMFTSLSPSTREHSIYFHSEGAVTIFPLTCVLDTLMCLWYSCTNFL